MKKILLIIVGFASGISVASSLIDTQPAKQSKNANGHVDPYKISKLDTTFCIGDIVQAVDRIAIDAHNSIYLVGTNRGLYKLDKYFQHATKVDLPAEESRLSVTKIMHDENGRVFVYVKSYDKVGKNHLFVSDLASSGGWTDIFAAAPFASLATDNILGMDLVGLDSASEAHGAFAVETLDNSGNGIFMVAKQNPAWTLTTPSAPRFVEMFKTVATVAKTGLSSDELDKNIKVLSSVDTTLGNVEYSIIDYVEGNQYGSVKPTVGAYWNNIIWDKTTTTDVSYTALPITDNSKVIYSLSENFGTVLPTGGNQMVLFDEKYYDAAKGTTNYKPIIMSYNPTTAMTEELINAEMVKNTNNPIRKIAFGISWYNGILTEFLNGYDDNFATAYIDVSNLSTDYSLAISDPITRYDTSLSYYLDEKHGHFAYFTDNDVAILSLGGLEGMATYPEAFGLESIGLSGLSIAGIVLGSIVGAGLIGLLGLVLYKRSMGQKLNIPAALRKKQKEVDPKINDSRVKIESLENEIKEVVQNKLNSKNEAEKVSIEDNKTTMAKKTSAKKITKKDKSK